MMRGTTVIVAIAMALGCARPGDRGSFDNLAEQFIAASVRGDSAAVTEMSTSAQVWNRVAVVRRQEPQLLAAAHQTRLRPYGPTAIGQDTAVLFYRFPYGTRQEEIGLTFILSRLGWLVHTISFPERM